MRVKSAIRKMVALGTGLTMVGATMFGAMAAADLKTYPAPFVSAGTYDATIVLGSSAKVDDVVGAIDIATSLQAANVISTPIAGGSSSVTVDTGAKFATSSTKLRYGGLLNNSKSTLTKTELPTLLATKSVTGTDGVSYDIRFEVNAPGASNVSFGKSVLDLKEPVLFYNWNGGGAYATVIKFPTTVNLTVLANKDISLFGKTYTVGTTSELSATKLTLYESGTDLTVDKGVPATVGANKLEVTSTNSNLAATTEGAAAIRVNGETLSVAKGSTYTLGTPQVRVYIKDIMTDPDAKTGSVRMFVGSEKVVIEDGNAVTKGTSNTVVDGTAITFTTASGKVSQISITTTPNSFAPQVKGLKVGESLKDPVFGTFKWLFHSFSPALDDSTREDTSFTASNTELTLKSKLTTGDINMVILRLNDTNATLSNTTYYGVSSSNKLWMGNSDTIAKNDYFIVNDDKDKSRVLRLTGVSNTSSTQTITVTDVSAASTAIWSHNGTAGTMTYDGKQYSFAITPTSTSDGTISLSSGMSNQLYTAKGALIGLGIAGNNNTQNVSFTEETSYNEDGNPDQYGRFNFLVTALEGSTGNDVLLGAPTYKALESGLRAWSDMIIKGDGASYPEQGVSPYGTFVETAGDSNSRTKVTLKYSGSQAEVNFFLAPTDAIASSSVSGSSSDKVVKIPVGFAQLDTDGTPTGNYIVVGGPCVNSIAATLLKSGADCKAGFVEGEATVKLFEQSNGKVALLVAGMTALDTRRATRVLNDYKTHQAAGTLTGTSVVVKGKTLTDISVASS